MVRLAGLEPALTPLRYYALEERSGTVVNYLEQPMIAQAQNPVH
jgi:hypothetical protein